MTQKERGKEGGDDGGRACTTDFGSARDLLDCWIGAHTNIHKESSVSGHKTQRLDQGQ